MHSFIPSFGSASSTKRKQTLLVAPNSLLYFNFGVCSLERCISLVTRTPVMAHHVFLKSVPRGSGLRMQDIRNVGPATQLCGTLTHCSHCFVHSFFMRCTDEFLAPPIELIIHTYCLSPLIYYFNFFLFPHCRGTLVEFFKPPVWHPQFFKVRLLEDTITEELFPLLALEYHIMHHFPPTAPTPIISANPTMISLAEKCFIFPNEKRFWWLYTAMVTVTCAVISSMSLQKRWRNTHAKMNLSSIDERSTLVSPM
jgi:hypothetical protein